MVPQVQMSSVRSLCRRCPDGECLSYSSVKDARWTASKWPNDAGARESPSRFTRSSRPLTTTSASTRSSTRRRLVPVDPGRGEARGPADRSSPSPYVVPCRPAAWRPSRRPCTPPPPGRRPQPDLTSSEQALAALLLLRELRDQASHKLISPSIPEIPSPISLAVIVVVLTASIVFSLRRSVPPHADAAAEQDGEAARPGRCRREPW